MEQAGALTPRRGGAAAEDFPRDPVPRRRQEEEMVMMLGAAAVLGGLVLIAGAIVTALPRRKRGRRVRR
ncbi:hypothetical protein GCM10010468_37160 [Actinocorallia longicatena]|uniref:Uncharacterized protein n=1 Tax=Actinocorallia longicatena TaxID=111803 RepID=A0ABP6QAI2_9ACTN